ncbi:YkvA family protein [Mitsuokella sp. oral taxon 131]|uniref:YkvA family protein n=1 Tax=Mitsuokella sp. oral taxon 131 TaxID=1321780 RepID=UPI0003AE4940|nr:DUF1232 domain-containing protein [Mitsuokella sp. oral taxon 131]ERL04476.1 hypothetical protein HMPREF1985_01254 [Mitsuokella sp. oral taxon 131 str. W9106]
MARVFMFLRLFRRDLIVMLLALKNPATPRRVKYLMALAALYLVSPIDLVPDTIPFFGLVDDAVIVPAAVYGLMHLLPHGVRAESEYQADYVLRHARAVLILASAFIVCWMALLLWGICRLLAG